jgi:glycosyltransferase involved in cell wall biosynthesis
MALDLHVGGGQRVIAELSGQMVRRGHEVHIIHPKGRGGYPIPFGVMKQEAGIEIPSPLASVVANLAPMIAAVPPCDWILTSMPLAALAGFIAGRLRHARVLSYVMGDERTLFDDRSLLDSSLLLQIYHCLTDLTQRLPVTIAVNSTWTQNRLRRGRGGDFPVIPNGVDRQIFRPDGPRLSRDATFTIVTVGRKHLCKGLADLIQALNLLAGNRPGREFQLWVITQDDLDFSEAHFPVRTFKPTSDGEIALAMRSADVLVHASWYEGFGLPPLEAMACGTPGVITDSGGVREYAVHNVNCLLTPPRDQAKLAGAIANLMDNPDLLNRLKAAGEATAARFPWERSAELLEAVLKTPLRNRTKQ